MPVNEPKTIADELFYQLSKETLPILDILKKLTETEPPKFKTTTTNTTNVFPENKTNYKDEAVRILKLAEESAAAGDGYSSGSYIAIADRFLQLHRESLRV